MSRRVSEFKLLAKVHYRPIEAAIRWSGLNRHEPRILAALDGRSTIEPTDFPRWPTLKLNHDRIFDAIVNRELAFCVRGIPAKDESQVTDSQLTVRHVDLRTWMSRYYPGERPAFLFDAARQSAPPLTIDTLNLIVQSERFRTVLERTDHEALRDVLLTARPARPVTPLNQVKESTIFTGTRGETTYLHIVGALVSLLLGRAPSGQPYSSFRSQEAVIDALIAHYGDRLGISERTLKSKFAAAKRSLDLS